MKDHKVMNAILGKTNKINEPSNFARFLYSMLRRAAKSEDAWPHIVDDNHPSDTHHPSGYQLVHVSLAVF